MTGNQERLRHGRKSDYESGASQNGVTMVGKGDYESGASQNGVTMVGKSDYES